MREMIGVSKKYYFVERIDAGSVFVFVKRFDDKKAAEDYAAFETLAAASERAVFFVREGFTYTTEAKERIAHPNKKEPKEEVKNVKTNSKKTITRKSASA